ncbi:unnamed protein product [Rotaria socialis]|nr:unnamed protein product [Rotaria socialis]CAF4879007.1 unnamed protein product [Rotaria socialis]
MRQKLLGQPTFRQSQVALSAAQANKDNDLGENPINQPEKYQDKTEKKISNFGEKIFIHYTHERRFHSCQRDMHKIYEDVFQQTPAMDTHLIVSNRNRRDIQHELIRKRPDKKLLQNKTTKKEKQPEKTPNEKITTTT